MNENGGAARIGQRAGTGVGSARGGSARERAGTGDLKVITLLVPMPREAGALGQAK